MFCNHKVCKIWSVDSQENYYNCCHQISHFKAKMPQIVCCQTLLEELTAIPRPCLLLREGRGGKVEGKGKRKGEGRGRRREGRAFPLLWFSNMTTDMKVTLWLCLCVQDDLGCFRLKSSSIQRNRRCYKKTWPGFTALKHCHLLRNCSW